MTIPYRLHQEAQRLWQRDIDAALKEVAALWGEAYASTDDRGIVTEAARQATWHLARALRLLEET